MKSFVRYVPIALPPSSGSICLIILLLPVLVPMCIRLFIMPAIAHLRKNISIHPKKTSHEQFIPYPVYS